MYLIYAPSYVGYSAGIRVLHLLNQFLIDAGYPSKIAVFGIPCLPQPYDIVIYPEIVKGNPLNAKHVVRYILNTPGLLGGDRCYSPNEILFAYSPHLSKHTPYIIQVPCIEPWFTNTHQIRTLDAFWVGKGVGISRIPLTTKMLEITRHWPSSRLTLAQLLNTIKTFYSYDNFTCLLPEAFSCGCLIRIIETDGSLREPKITYFEEIKAFPKQLKDFIFITQKMINQPKPTRSLWNP